MLKAFGLIIAIATGLLLVSTLICGLWIKANNVTDTSSILFHMRIAITTVVFGMASVVFLIILELKH